MTCVTYANEQDGVELPLDRSSLLIDQVGRTWRRCNQCLLHYLTERHQSRCPKCRLDWGAVPEPTRGDGTTSLSLGFEQSLLDAERERAEPQGEPGWMPLKLRTDL